MWYGYKKRVKLLVDLTKYHPKLIVGQLGFVIPDLAYSMWGRGSDRFGAVHFDCGAKLDIVLNNLEFLNENTNS